MKRLAKTAGVILQALILGLLLFVAVVQLAKSHDQISVFQYEKY